MTEEKKDYYILTDSKEGFEEIENAYEKLKENYVLDSINSMLIVRRDPIFKDEIHIYPEFKRGEIKEITARNSNLDARILKSGQNSWEIKIKENKYIIKHKNPQTIE